MTPPRDRRCCDATLSTEPIAERRNRAGDGDHRGDGRLVAQAGPLPASPDRYSCYDWPVSGLEDSGDVRALVLVCEGHD